MNIVRAIIPDKVRQAPSIILGLLQDKYYLLPKDRITYAHDLLYTYHNADFLNDPLFKEAYRLGKSTDRDQLLKNYDIEWRIHVMCWAAAHAAHLEGDFVDCGVHTGICARHRGDIYQEVKETFKDFNVEIIKGTVPDTLEKVTSKKIAYLSVDMNCVQPEYDTLNFFWDRMVPGGMIILDDYGYANSTNDQRAIHDKFAKEKGVQILSLPTCQGLIIKP
jgi:hypothetical protein